MTAALTPAGCDLRDFPRMMIDIPRLFASEFNASASDAAWRAGVTLWLKAFHQTPAASLPDDDGQLARLAEMGRDVRSWAKLRAAALRGWVRCDDGRLYHPVVAEMALEAWLEKLARRLSSGAGNAKQYGTPFDPVPIEAEIEGARAMLVSLNPASRALRKARLRTAKRLPDDDGAGSQCDPAGTPAGSPPGSQGTGTGTETGTGIDIDLGASAKPPRPAGRPPQVKGWQADQAFARAWEACTDAMRRRSDSRAKTWPVWKRAAEAAGGGDALVRALGRYLREDPDVQRTGGPGFRRWLADGTWDHWLGQQGGRDAASWGEDQWAAAVRLWRDGKGWSDRLGPEPGRPGCRVPQRLLVEPVRA